MKRLMTAGILAGLLMLGQPALAQDLQVADSMAETQMVAADSAVGDLTVEELIGADDMAALDSLASEGGFGLHDQLKTKFMEGDPRFMSLVALVLVLGLALSIERIIYLTLAEINTKKLLADIEKKVEAGDVEGAKTICRDTRGPVASVCYQGLMHIDEPVEDIERSAFDQIQTEGDIGPTIVAEGMKVALLTTIFGIVVALILQVFYNFVNSRIDRLTIQMEEGAITLLDIISKSKRVKE